MRPALQGTPARDALDSAITAIGAAGCQTPRLDAELLLAHVLGLPRERLLVEIAAPDGGVELEGATVRSYQQAVRRRAFSREPVAYITGRCFFRRLELRADRRALVPRPETELLVEAGLALPVAASVLDVGTGGGAVALALKDERSDLLVSGSDISEQALELACSNALELGLALNFFRADLLHEVPDEFDAVLANLPYVADGERAALAPEIVRHEPHAALFAGPDGIEAIGALLAALAVRPRVQSVTLEVGAGQAARVDTLVRGAGFGEVRSLRDLAGIERVVTGRR